MLLGDKLSLLLDVKKKKKKKKELRWILFVSSWGVTVLSVWAKEQTLGWTFPLRRDKCVFIAYIDHSLTCDHSSAMTRLTIYPPVPLPHGPLTPGTCQLIIYCWWALFCRWINNGHMHTHKHTHRETVWYTSQDTQLHMLKEQRSASKTWSTLNGKASTWIYFEWLMAHVFPHHDFHSRN